MKKTKESGISLITLVVTIIVILILAGVGTYTGIETINNSKKNKFYTELKIMQSYVNNWYEELKPTTGAQVEYNNIFNQNIAKKLMDAGVEIKLATSSQALQETGETAYQNDYYILEKQDLEALRVENVEQTILVNFKRRKVISYEGYEQANGEIMYTLDGTKELYNVEYEP